MSLLVVLVTILWAVFSDCGGGSEQATSQGVSRYERPAAESLTTPRILNPRHSTALRNEAIGRIVTLGHKCQVSTPSNFTVEMMDVAGDNVVVISNRVSDTSYSAPMQPSNSK
jgi:hypothetical protein